MLAVAWRTASAAVGSETMRRLPERSSWLARRLEIAAALLPDPTGAMNIVWTVPSFCAMAFRQRYTAISETGRGHRRAARQAADTAERLVFLTTNRLLQSGHSLHQFRDDLSDSARAKQAVAPG